MANTRPIPAAGVAIADASPAKPLVTPDGRYIIVRGRLWRTANPFLPQDRRDDLVRELMKARRAVRWAKRSGDPIAEDAAHAAVNAAKEALGERGPPWWNDGAADQNRHLVRNTQYAGWYEETIGTGKLEQAGMSAASLSALPAGRF